MTAQPGWTKKRENGRFLLMYKMPRARFVLVRSRSFLAEHS
jgi:hypothetical protein